MLLLLLSLLLLLLLLLLPLLLPLLLRTPYARMIASDLGECVQVQVFDFSGLFIDFLLEWSQKHFAEAVDADANGAEILLLS